MLYNLANLPYWILLGLGIALFLFVIASGGGDDDLDLDADGDWWDVDADAEVDGDFDFSVIHILGWLGVGKVPLILLLATDFSFWGLIGWMLNVFVAGFTGKIPTHFFGIGGLILVASLISSLFVGSWISRPIGKLFAPFGQDASGDRLIGCVGTVVSKKIPSVIEGKIGQVDVLDTDDNLVSVSATLPQWATAIPHRGQQVLVIDRRTHSYLVIAKDTSDEDKWLANKQDIRDSHRN